jgi:hypothetical protein
MFGQRPVVLRFPHTYGRQSLVPSSMESRVIESFRLSTAQTAMSTSNLVQGGYELLHVIESFRKDSSPGPIVDPETGLRVGKGQPLMVSLGTPCPRQRGSRPCWPTSPSPPAA